MRMRDLLILGGGPAGAVSAILAARDGLSVTLVDPCRGRERIEGMSPRLSTWLTRMGLLEGFSDLHGPLLRRADWSGLHGARNGESVVDRAALDRHLRAQAAAAGAQVIEASGAPEGEGVRLGDGTLLRAPLVFDARGRAAHAGRRGLRAPATVSLCAWVRGAAGAEPGATIAAIPEGWVWCARLADGRLWAQFTGDAASPLPPAARLRAALAAADPAVFARDLTIEGLGARETAPILPAPVEDLTRMPVGDAFAAMDPLSGHGQFWAVSSALAAAAARRTLAARPGSEDLVRRFLQGRAAETYIRNARIGRDFLRMETRFAAAPFWAARRDFPDDVPAHETRDAIEIARRPVVEEGLIAEADILLTPRSPAGVGWFGTIPAAEAWAMLLAGAPEAAFAERWGAAAASIPARLDAEMIPAH